MQKVQNSKTLRLQTNLKFGLGNLSFPMGFTLLELLVVISIIGILAGLTLVSFTGAQRQARDTQRQSDLKQYQNLLEVHATNRRGLYPSKITNPVRLDQLCGDPLLATGCPRDPSTPTYEYYYISDGSGGSPTPTNATRFVMWAYQENSSQYFIICSNGKTGTGVVPINNNCPI